MFKIQRYNQISSRGLDRFPRANYEIASEFNEPDAFIVRSFQVTPEHIKSSLKAIARAGAGVNNIPVDFCTEKGIVVFNTPGANANAVKELVLTAMLLSSRGILDGVQYVNTLSEMTNAKEIDALIEKEKGRFKGGELMDKTLGIIGLGAIGSLLADTCLKLGMTVAGYDPSLSVDAAWRLSNETKKMESLQSLLSRSDYVSLHLPLLDATRNLINADTIRFFKPGTRLMNFSRGGIVNNAAVLTALENGLLDCYATDFPTPELIGKKGVICFPHLGASTDEAEENCAIMAADQLMDFLQNGNIMNSVNFPTVSLERTTGHRLAIVNKNISGMLQQITATLGSHKSNILEVVNKSKDNLAYNLLDIQAPATPDLLADLTKIEGVVRVWSL